MPAAIQTSVLDVLKSAQDAATGNLNVNAVVTGSDATIVNGAGASAVNIQDGGNSITVDGSITVSQSTASNLKVDLSGTAANATAIKVDGSAVTQPISGTVSINALTNSSVVKAQLQDNSGNALNSTSNALDVNVKNTSIAISPAAIANSEFVRNAYASTSVTTSAYVQLIASTAAQYQFIEIFDSSGQTLKIAFGGAGAEVDKFLVFPGGNGRIERTIPASTRISIKAVSATASVGEIDINLYG